MFGSLVVCLPVEFEGGVLNVAKEHNTKTFNWGTSTKDSSGASWIQWAAFFSYLAAFLVGAIAFVAVLYMVNYIYIDIINKVSSSAKYSSIEKKNDAAESQPLMKSEAEI